MAIPEFIDGYHLPPGEHIATLQEVEVRFATNTPERQRVWGLFSSLLERLRDLGISPRALLIDGSFVTGREEPGDVDVAMLFHPQDIAARLAACKDTEDQKGIIILTDINFNGLIRAVYGAHLLAAKNQADLDGWSLFFRRGDPSQGGLRPPDPNRDPLGVVRPQEKGIIRVNL